MDMCCDSEGLPLWEHFSVIKIKSCVSCDVRGSLYSVCMHERLDAGSVSRLAIYIYIYIYIYTHTHTHIYIERVVCVVGHAFMHSNFHGHIFLFCHVKSHAVARWIKVIRGVSIKSMYGCAGIWERKCEFSWILHWTWRAMISIAGKQ